MHRFLKYGLSKQTGALVSVEEVLRGLKCDCICPECKSTLIARQGKEKQWHFAHANNAECAGARMTALHLWAQQIIQEEKQDSKNANEDKQKENKAEDENKENKVKNNASNKKEIFLNKAYVLRLFDKKEEKKIAVIQYENSINFIQIK